MNRCEGFVKALCKVKGLSYAKMRKKYVYGPYRKTVYAGNDVIEGHCIHCARAEAISEYEKNGR